MKILRTASLGSNFTGYYKKSVLATSPWMEIKQLSGQPSFTKQQ